MVDLNFDEFFEWSPHRGTRDHKYKLYRKPPGTWIRSEFFSECIITVWNKLSVSTDFSTTLLTRCLHIKYQTITIVRHFQGKVS